MNYGVVWQRGALDHVAALGGTSILDCIDVSIRHLAEDPSGLSIRSFHHEFPGALSFDFRCRGDAGYVSLRAHFYYLDNETDIRIVDVTVVLE
jgi:hypothetical protein